jgi:exonuclease SbcD
MGHVHQFQVLSETPLIAHVGSMERTDFGEAGQPKVFALLEASGGRLSWEFFDLPVKPLCDIAIDKSSDPPDGMMDGIRCWLEAYALKQPLANSIVRVAITVSEAAAHAVDTAEVARLLVKDMDVSNCVGVHAIVVSRRQLRDATITEKIDPRAAFNKWLERNVADQAVRDEMAKAGLRIIDERSCG